MLETLLLLNKPSNCSSFDCIRRLKPFFPKRTRIGHAGTLDPFATGLLIICIGRGATKHLSSFMQLPKTYTGTAHLGQVTTTLDRTGATLENNRCEPLSHEDLTSALTTLGSMYEQTPPAYSALKHNGTPLYKLARTGAVSKESLSKIVQSKKRMVTLYRASIETYSHPLFTVTATVSHGTYIRTLLHDIAQRAGCSGATTHALHRSSIGPFQAKDALPLSEMSQSTLEHYLIPIDVALKQCV